VHRLPLLDGILEQRLGFVLVPIGVLADLSVGGADAGVNRDRSVLREVLRIILAEAIGGSGLVGAVVSEPFVLFQPGPRLLEVEVVLAED